MISPDFQQPVDFSGKYFQLKEAILLPRPGRAGGPPILIGGNGAKRTLGLAARYAHEWNAVFISPTEFRRLNALLDEQLAQVGRAPDSMRRSLMTGCIYAKDAEQLNTMLTARSQTAADLRQRGLVVAAGNEVTSQLNDYAEAGVQRIMLQWIDLDDIAGLEWLAKQVY